NYPVYPGVHDRMLSLTLQTNHGGRESIRPKRKSLDSPTERKQNQSEVGKQRRGPRQHMPAEHIESSDDRQSHKSRCQNGKQEQFVCPGLITVNRQLGTLLKQGGVDAVDGDRADSPDDEQYCQQHPSAPPRERPGRNEQEDRDQCCIGEESDKDSEHRY